MKTPLKKNCRIKFNVRVAAFFLFMLAIVHGSNFFVVNTAVQQNSEDVIKKELDIGTRIFFRLRQFNLQRLREAAKILATDFGFRQAIATRDNNTILSVLENHGARINAKRMILLDLDNTIIADMQNPDISGKPFPFPELTDLEHDVYKQTPTVEIVDNQAYELIAVPVNAPITIAWVVMGFELDNKLAAELKSLSNLDISFITQSSTLSWQILATTLPKPELHSLKESLLSIKKLDKANIKQIFTSGKYKSLLLTLEQTNTTILAAVLHRNLPEALAPIETLKLDLFWLMLLMLLPSILLSLVLARNVTRPIIQLAHAARNIGKGGYNKKIGIRRSDEIGELALSFDHMSQVIQHREKEILDLAYIDGLTQLPNRTLFIDRLQKAIDQAKTVNKPLTILFMDIDRFKEVNKVLGHNLGDKLIKIAGIRLSGAFSDLTDTVARLGGDEFAVLLPHHTCISAQEHLTQLLPTLERPVMLDNYQVDVGVSTGIACFPEHGKDAGTLLQCADAAMYIAKRQSNGMAIFDPLHISTTEFNLSIIGDLKRAARENEFVLYYQPKVNIATQTVHSVETLIRWIHPQHGLIAPDKFIPIAEQTGNICEITRWVLDSALAQMAIWRDKNYSFEVAVNISVRDLEDDSFPIFIMGLLDKYRLPSDKLVLEITEGALMTDPEAALKIVHMLSRLGIKLSIDDYGSGFSSLSYIKKLPVQELKIDKTFVSNMASDEDDVTIVRSTIDLGHNMGLKVVAEGVENQEIWNMLHEIGCDIAQGYFLSKPMIVEELEKWIDNTKPEQ